MNPRERFINYVKQGGEEPFVSLQIGGGAGFDCKLAGKEWLSEGLDVLLNGTIEDIKGDCFAPLAMTKLKFFRALFFMI